FVARSHPLAFDYPLFDHVTAGRGQPVHGPQIGAGLQHFADVALRHAEIAQPLNGPVLPDASSIQQVYLRLLNIGAVDAKERLVGVDVLASLADEQLLDVSLGPEGNDRQSAFVVHHGAHGPDWCSDHPLLHHFGADTTALDFFDAYFDRVA